MTTYNVKEALEAMIKEGIKRQIIVRKIEDNPSDLTLIQNTDQNFIDGFAKAIVLNENPKDSLREFDNLYYSYIDFDDNKKQIVVNEENMILKGKNVEVSRLNYLLRTMKYLLSERIKSLSDNKWESNLLVAVGHNDATPFKRKNLMGHLALVD